MLTSDFSPKVDGRLREIGMCDALRRRMLFPYPDAHNENRLGS